MDEPRIIVVKREPRVSELHKGARVSIDGVETRIKYEDLGDFPVRKRPEWDVGWAIFWFLILVWTVILWAGWLGKYAGQRERPYSAYLTNWSFTLQALFFAAWLIGRVDWSGHVQYWVYGLFFWPTFTTSWAVFLLVMYVLQDSPGLLLEMFQDYDAGFVFLANTIYHYLPIIVMLCLFFMIKEDLQDYVRLKPGFFLLFTATQILLAHFPVLIYAIAYDPVQMYRLNTLHWWHILLLYELFAIILWLCLWILLISPFVKTARVGGTVPRSVIISSLSSHPRKRRSRSSSL